MDGNLARSVKKPTKIAKHAGRITFERLKKQNSYSARYVLKRKLIFIPRKKSLTSLTCQLLQRKLILNMRGNDAIS